MTANIAGQRKLGGMKGVEIWTNLDPKNERCANESAAPQPESVCS